MVQGIDRRQQEDDSSVLQASSSGGLNVMSSSLSIPLQDSPDMNNVKINQRGNVQKRLGSQRIANIDSGGSGLSGATLDTVKFRNLPSLIVSKLGKDISVSAFNEGVTNNFAEILALTNVINFSNVFSDRARYVKADTVQTSELEPRIIMTTGVNTPVQVKFVQSISFDTTYDSGANESTTDFSNTNLSNASTSNIFIFEDGRNATNDLVSVNFSNNVLSVTTTGNKTNTEMSVVFVSWQWWAEASATEGNKLYARSSRFNNQNVDRFIELPSDLLVGIQPLRNYNPQNPRYPLILASDDSHTDYSGGGNVSFYGYSESPSNSSEYVFTKPGTVDLSIDNEIKVGLGVAAFGALESSGNETPLHFHRGLPVFFNGDRGVEGQFLSVAVGDTNYSQNIDRTSPQNNSYYLKLPGTNYFVNPVSDQTTRGTHIDFTADEPTGVNFTSFIQAINNELNFIGSGAQRLFSEYGEGSFVPGYGLWEFCDYQEGSFPRTVNIIQNRLVFAGTPKLPLRVAVSEVGDSLVPGRNYRDFQTTFSFGDADEAFQFDIQARLNTKITAIEPFNNALFIFTNNETYRLTGGDSGLRPDSFFVQFQVGIGCVNSRCVQRIENTMYFMSDNGVFDISGTDDAAEYATAERSLKVRDFFDSNKYDEDSAWMAYDEKNSELYVGTTNNSNIIEENNPWTAENLLVYSPFRNTWQKFTDYSGRAFTLDGDIIKKKDGRSSVVLLTTSWEGGEDLNGSPTTGNYVVLGTNRPIDYHTYETLSSDESSGWTRTIDLFPAKRCDYDMAKGRYFYPTNEDNDRIGKESLFSLLPHREIEDVKVEVSYDGGSTWQQLTFNDDFVKMEQNYSVGIYLLSVVPDDDKKVRITKLSQPEDENWQGNIHPIRFWLDNQLLVENEDYTIELETNIDEFNYKATFLFDAKEEAVLEYGFIYDTWHFSPKFFRGNLSTDKRFVHWYGYFYNEPYNDVYDVTDVNDFSEQDPTSIAEAYKTPVGFNLVFNYNDTDSGYVSSSDIYGTLDLFWDVGQFDIGSPINQFNKYSRISEPIIGASYNFQVGLINSRAAYFEQVGYQVTLLQQGVTSNRARNAPNNFAF